MRLHETCAGDLLKTEFSFTPIKKKEKELKENREKAREDARKNRVSEKIPVSGKELGLYLYEKYKADEPDPLGLSDLEKKLESEKELKRAGDPRVMEAYAGLSEVSDALNALKMMASTVAYGEMYLNEENAFLNTGIHIPHCESITACSVLVFVINIEISEDSVCPDIYI